MLLHHGLRIAAARCASVLERKVMVLLWRAILTLMQLRIWTSHWSHCVHVKIMSNAHGCLTYWILVAFDTFEELAHRAACTSLVLVEGVPVASPVDSSSGHLALGYWDIR
jgi:hypothetical protein